LKILQKVGKNSFSLAFSTRVETTMAEHLCQYLFMKKNHNSKSISR